MYMGAMLPKDLKETRRLLEVVHDLRTRCPWDRKQTHKTLTRYLLEEAYEAVDAIQSQKKSALCEELGDVLLQVALHSEIASEKGDFSFEEVAKAIADKMIFRHPHIYKQQKALDYKSHLKNWTRLKEMEKPKKKLLEGIPRAMPALQLAQRYGEIAGSVGFDWASEKEVMKKVKEELSELLEELNKPRRRKEALEMELGDLLFSLTQLARHLKLDAESALKASAAKFENRFTEMEKRKTRKGKKLTDFSLKELDDEWNKTKLSLRAKRSNPVK
jgi:tetrapyrrole methylase family protein / MazG family protein